MAGDGAIRSSQKNDMGFDENGGFVAVGIARKGWATSEPVRAIFKRAFAAAGIPAFAPGVAGPPLYGNEPDPRADEGGVAKPWSCRYHDDFLQLWANTDATAKRADSRDRCGTCRYQIRSGGRPAGCGRPGKGCPRADVRRRRK